MSSPFPCVGGIIAKFIVAAMNQSGGETSGLIRWLSLVLYGWKVIQWGSLLPSWMRLFEPLIHTHSLGDALDLRQWRLQDQWGKPALESVTATLGSELLRIASLGISKARGSLLAISSWKWWGFGALPGSSKIPSNSEGWPQATWSSKQSLGLGVDAASGDDKYPTFCHGGSWSGLPTDGAVAEQWVSPHHTLSRQAVRGACLNELFHREREEPDIIAVPSGMLDSRALVTCNGRIAATGRSMSRHPIELLAAPAPSARGGNFSQ
jgi:hypothetical protein